MVRPFASTFDGELQQHDTLEDAIGRAKLAVMEVEREATDGVDDDLMAGIVVLQVIAHAQCDNPEYDYRLHRYSLHNKPDLRERTPRRLLERLMYELSKVEDTSANKHVDPNVEDSHWLAGNIPQTLVDEIKEMLAKPPAVDLYMRQHALLLLKHGWEVRLSPSSTEVMWRSPGGISGSDFMSDSIDCPPPAVLKQHAAEMKARNGRNPTVATGSDADRTQPPRPRPNSPE